MPVLPQGVVEFFQPRGGGAVRPRPVPQLRQTVPNPEQEDDEIRRRSASPCVLRLRHACDFQVRQGRQQLYLAASGAHRA